LASGGETRTVFMPAMERSRYAALCWANAPKPMPSRTLWGQILRAPRNRSGQRAVRDGSGARNDRHTTGLSPGELPCAPCRNQDRVQAHGRALISFETGIENIAEFRRVPS
jgi:hypothetical protein